MHLVELEVVEVHTFRMLPVILMVVTMMRGIVVVVAVVDWDCYTSAAAVG
jgi:hypothetical protein